LEEDEQSLQWAFKYPPDLIITCAQYLVDHVRKSLPESYREKQKIVAVPNAVDTQRFRPADKRQAKARIGMPSDLPVVLMLANLAPHKGQETAIRAISLLKKHGMRVHCWIAGIERTQEKGYTAYLRSLVQALSLEHDVRFLGQRDDAPELL